MGTVIKGDFSKKNINTNKQKIAVSRKYRVSGFVGEHVGPCPHCGADMVLVDFRHDGKMGLCYCETPDLKCLYKCLVPLLDRSTPEGLNETKALMQERLELTDEQWSVFTAGLVAQDRERRTRRSR